MPPSFEPSTPPSHVGRPAPSGLITRIPDLLFLQQLCLQTRLHIEIVLTLLLNSCPFVIANNTLMHRLHLPHQHALAHKIW